MWSDWRAEVVAADLKQLAEDLEADGQSWLDGKDPNKQLLAKAAAVVQ